MCRHLSDAICITFWIVIPSVFGARTSLQQNNTLAVPGMTFGICSFSIESIMTPGNCTGYLDPSCKCLELTQGTFMSCSQNNLTEVPSGISPNTSVLLLDYNQINAIPNATFWNSRNLIYLDMSYNNISVIMNGSFKRLHRLETLLLHNNRLHYTHSSLLSINLNPLHSLKCLRIEQKENVKDQQQYPISALQSLHNLNTLYMNGIPDQQFTAGFSNLTHLRALVLSGVTGQCNLTSVARTAFTHLSQVTQLSLLDCNLSYIEKGSFEEMVNLISLNLSYNTDLTFHSMVNISYGLLHLSRFESLNLTRIHPLFGECTYIDAAMLQYLNETNVKELILDSNRLSLFKEGAIYFLPSNLSYISVRDNKMDMGLYLIEIICDFREVFSSMRTVIISDQNNRRIVGRLFSQHRRNVWTKDNGVQSSGSVRHDHSKNNRQGISYDQCIFHILEECSSCPFTFHPCPFPSRTECLYPFPVALPSHLETVDFSGSKYKFPLKDICLCSPNNLTNLNLSRNLVYSFSGPFYGFENLETLDLAENYCNNITESSFENMTNLRLLNLSSNYLGTSINSDYPILPFKNLTKLTVLDLSNNKLRTLPSDIFSNLDKMEYLLISENRLSNLRVVLSKLTKLQYLDLSYNLLENINGDARASLDMIATRNNLTINLYGNQFTCTCKYEEYIKWLYLNRNRFVHFDQYYCHFDNSDTAFLNDQAILERLRKQCTNYTAVIIGTSLVIVLTLIILTAAVLYRYRWHIRYMYYSAKIRYKGYTRVNDDDYFRYDVFVSYADTDNNFIRDKMIQELENNRGLRLLIHERDFPFGTLVTENIHRAISSSRRTMLVISPGFLQSKWCKYEMNIAKIEAINRDKEVLCVIMKEPVSKSDMPLELVDIIANNTYLTVPPEMELCARFWDSIEASVKRN